MKFESKLLRGFLELAPKEDIRYYLNGVHVKGNRIEVTNGHYCFVGHQENDVEEKIFSLIGSKIPQKAVETEIVKTTCEELGDTYIAIHRDNFKRPVGSNVVEFRDGNFPDIDKAVAGDFKECSQSEIRIQSCFLGLPAKVFGKDANMMTMTLNEKGVAKLSFEEKLSGNITGYVMPFRAK